MLRAFVIISYIIIMICIYIFSINNHFFYKLLVKDLINEIKTQEEIARYHARLQDGHFFRRDTQTRTLLFKHMKYFEDFYSNNVYFFIFCFT